MAQITGAVSSNAFKVEISTDGSVWTDISGAANTLEYDGGGKITGETYTFDGNDPIVTTGKNEPAEVTVAAVYTEGASDVFETIRPLYEAGSDAYIRWSPKGGQTGEFMFTSATAGRITALTYPGGDASSGDPIMTGFTWRGPKPTKSVVA